MRSLIAAVVSYARGDRRGGLALYVDPTTGIGREKRRSPRHPSTRGLRLRWRSAGQDLEQAGVLVDISRSGALAIVPALIDVGQRVLISLEGSGVRVKATVWRVEPGQSGHRVRLAFIRPCSRSFLDGAIGLDAG